MEITFGESNLNSLVSKGAFDSVFSSVAGNKFFDQKALNKIQTDDLREAFFDWSEAELFGVGENEEHKSIIAEVTAGLEEYREDRTKFNVAESKRDNIRIQIDKLEKQQAYEESLSLPGEIDSDVVKQIAQLKSQLLQIQEG